MNQFQPSRKKNLLWLLLLVLSLTGCVSPPLPVEIANIPLVPVPTEAIEVRRPAFRMRNGQLQLDGFVLRQSDAKTTANSHVDIVFLDAAGRPLRIESTEFNPRDLPTAHRLPRPHGYFSIPVPQLPAGTRAIEVRGHDGPHDQAAK